VTEQWAYSCTEKKKPRGLRSQKREGGSIWRREKKKKRKRSSLLFQKKGELVLREGKERCLCIGGGFPFFIRVWKKGGHLAEKRTVF